MLLVLRLLYGIGMGGEWGLGASLAMEKVPPGKRGLVSGIVQQGYAVGYMLAAVAYLLIDEPDHWGWRGLFAFSALPALVALFVRARVTESEVWEETRANADRNKTTVRQILSDADRAAPLRLPRAADDRVQLDEPRHPGHLPDVPEEGSAASRENTALYIAILYNVGALLGGTIMGAASERFGRRAVVVFCAVLGLPILPLFAASHDARHSSASARS